MKKKRGDRNNYIIMVARTVMKETGITVELVGDDSIQEFTQSYRKSVYTRVAKMSPETRGRIVEKALAPGSTDEKTSPRRVTYWGGTHDGLIVNIVHSSGDDILNDIATAVVLATIWDIINPTRRKKA